MTEKKKKQIEDFDNEIGKHSETVDVFKAQLRDSENDLKELDGLQAKELETILDKLPSATPKGLLDEILKVSTPKRTQILNNISKLSTSIKIEQGKLAKLSVEKKDVVKALRDNSLNELTSKLCDGLKDTIDAYLKFENLFLNFKAQAGEVGQFDKNYHARVDGKRYSSFYNQVLGLTLMQPAGLPGLTPLHFIETIQNIGNERENPLKTDQRFAREENNQPILHDISDPPALSDRQLEDKIGEIFERPNY